MSGSTVSAITSFFLRLFSSNDSHQQKTPAGGGWMRAKVLAAPLRHSALEVPLTRRYRRPMPAEDASLKG